jgi:hypothetical protein
MMDCKVLSIKEIFLSAHIGCCFRDRKSVQMFNKTLKGHGGATATAAFHDPDPPRAPRSCVKQFRWLVRSRDLSQRPKGRPLQGGGAFA